MITRFELRKYSKLTSGWSGSYTNITDAYDINVTRSATGTTDTVSFKINNHNNTNIDNYNTQDKIEVYYVINQASIDGNNLILTGIIKTIEEETTESGSYIKITAVSFSDLLGTALIFKSTSNVNVMTLITQVAQTISYFTSDITLTVSAPTLKSDGTAFPLINSGGQVNIFYVPLKKVINDYLTPTYTQDGNYYYYVNTNNVLVIAKRTTSGALILIEGVDFKSLKTSLDVSGVYNYIITKCGTDLNGSPITAVPSQDLASIQRNGFKFYMLVDTSIADRAKALYPGDNASVISYMKAQGKIKGDEYLALHNEGTHKIALSMYPTTSYSVGNILSITAPSYNMSSVPARILGITYTLDGIELDLAEEVFT